MKENYLISIKGIQVLDGEKDSIEMTTGGSYIQKNNHTYIGYKEYDPDNPEISSNNLVKVESKNKVIIMRNEGKQTRLILEKGKRHQCHYRTIMGDLMVGVYCDTIECKLDENGGKLYASYTLDFNGSFASKNEFYITVDSKENN